MRAAFRGRAVSSCLAAALCAAVLGGCASRAAPQPGSDGEARATLEFINESSDRAEIFALERGGSTMRVGTVLGGKTEIIEIPQYVVARRATVVIAARLRLRSRVLTTGDMVIRPGEQLKVHLPADERMLVLLPGKDPAEP